MTCAGFAGLRLNSCFELHHFWGCPVAQAVVGVLQQHLAGWFSDALQPQHVLCMVCPVAVGVVGAPALHKGVRRVVCLAAISAMDEGRVAANKLTVQRREEQQAAADAAWLEAAMVPAGQQLISALLQPAPLTPAQQQHRDQVRQPACRAAIAPATTAAGAATGCCCPPCSSKAARSELVLGVVAGLRCLACGSPGLASPAGSRPPLSAGGR